MGIPLRTRHREVAPNQYEFAPLFGTVVTQVDQNLVVMQARRRYRERARVLSAHRECAGPFAGD